MSKPVLEVRDVVKRYGRFAALDGVNFTVQPGERFGLLGPNGAGKTTLMTILAGLKDPNEGSVHLFEKPFRSTDRARRHLVGLATQDLSIYPELTAQENLLFFGRLYGMTRTDLHKRVDEMLASVGLEDRAKSRVSTFSGGMKRRLNLAVAVVHRPKILFLDEPTTGVDPQSRNHIFDQIRAFNAGGLTVIYTSHYMEEVQALCPRIAILDVGKVLACDTVTNLIATFPAVARVRIATTPAGLLEEIRRLPAVLEAKEVPNGLEVSAKELPPIIAPLVTLLNSHNVQPLGIDLDQPTLEKVFLSLTGRKLRD